MPIVSFLMTGWLTRHCLQTVCDAGYVTPLQIGGHFECQPAPHPGCPGGNCCKFWLQFYSAFWCNLSGGNNPQQSIRIETNLFKDGQQCFAGTAQMRKRVRRDEHKERFDSWWTSKVSGRPQSDCLPSQRLDYQDFNFLFTHSTNHVLTFAIFRYFCCTQGWGPSWKKPPIARYYKSWHHDYYARVWLLGQWTN